MFRAAHAFVEDYGPDHISFDLGDPGGITTRFLAKVPGPQMRLGQARMEFTYEASFGTQGLEPYERLLYDAMLGDRTLFTDAEGIESLWAASSALVEDPPPLHRYTPWLLRTAEDARADRAAALVAAGDLTSAV
jgi:glucose-6-phosphate 1-dehydrogenase